MTFYLRNIFKRFTNKNHATVQLRYYPRWSHRRPVRVLSPEEFNEMENKPKENSKANEISDAEFTNYDYKEKETSIKWRPSAGHFPKLESPGTPINFDDINVDKAMTEAKKKAKLFKPNKKSSSVDMLETVIGSDGKLVYTKMKDNDSRIGSLFITIKSRKEKDKKDVILLEGVRLIKEALQSGCRLKNLLFSRKNDVDSLLPYLPKTGAKIYKMPYREMQMWSNLTTSPGIMGIFKTPESETRTPPKDHLPIIVICDNIREPGNLGAVIRNCAALACEKIILTNGCVNLWDTKVTRSSAGGHFKLQIHKNVDWSSIQNLIPHNAAVYIADNKIITESTPEVLKKSIKSDEKQKNNVSGNVTEGINLVDILQMLPIVPYYSVDFKQNNETVLIIGGETEGISEDSYRFAYSRKGLRLNIPLNNDIESLNTGTALGIITFEMKRQLSAKQQAKNTNDSESGNMYINVVF